MGIAERTSRLWHSRHRRLLARYSVGSVVATLVAQVVFAALYTLGVDARVASVCAYLAGVVPNYQLNRRWTWGHRSATGTLAPYLVVVGVSLLVVTLATGWADGVVRGLDAARAVEVALVTGAFLAINATVFLVKYVLFDRVVFGRDARG